MHFHCGLGYLTQEDILKSHPFAWKIHDVLVFKSWLVFYCVDASHFRIHSSVEGHLGGFQSLAIMHKAAMNIVEQVSLWDDGASFVYMLRSSIAGAWERENYSKFSE